MKSIRNRFLAAALAVLAGTMIAKAQDAPPMHGHEFGRGDHMMGFFADYLNVTDAQREQMKGVMQKEHATMKPLMQQLHATHQQLRQFELGAYDEAKVRALAAQEAQVQTELTVQKTRIHSELFQMLTPDQQAKMKEFVARRQARMQKRMQERNNSGAPAPTEQ
jgi:periplasmic protein CpxP/Spy